MEGAALLCIDLVNDIVHPSGKLAGKGYVGFANAHQSLENVSKLQEFWRNHGGTIVHIYISFESNYVDHPEKSPLFGGARAAKAFQEGSWGTQFVDVVKPLGGEIVIRKPRVSVFYGTPLESLLRAAGINRILLAGVASDLAIAAAARDAHDRDFGVTVIENCCIAASQDDHVAAFRSLAKIGTIRTVESIREGK